MTHKKVKVFYIVFWLVILVGLPAAAAWYWQGATWLRGASASAPRMEWYDGADVTCTITGGGTITACELAEGQPLAIVEGAEQTTTVILNATIQNVGNERTCMSVNGGNEYVTFSGNSGSGVMPNEYRIVGFKWEFNDNLAPDSTFDLIGNVIFSVC